MRSTGIITIVFISNWMLLLSYQSTENIQGFFWLSSLILTYFAFYHTPAKIFLHTKVTAICSFVHCGVFLTLMSPSNDIVSWAMWLTFLIVIPCVLIFIWQKWQKPNNLLYFVLLNPLTFIVLANPDITFLTPLAFLHPVVSSIPFAILWIIGTALIILYHQKSPKNFALLGIWTFLCLPEANSVFTVWFILAIAIHPKRCWIWCLLILPFENLVILHIITLVLFVWEINNGKRIASPTYPKPKSLDIIIPTLNEEDVLERCLNNIAQATTPLAEVTTTVYIVDGGSSDQTLKIASQYPTEVISCSKKGRGYQIDQGVQQGSGDLILILHADATIGKHALISLWQRLEEEPQIVWGALGDYILDHWLFQVMYQTYKLFYALLMANFLGDQGMFFRREAIEQVGFPATMIMEDVEISARLSHYPYINLGQFVKNSPRRWIHQGFWKTCKYALMVEVWIPRYMLRRRMGTSIEKIGEQIYEEYYGVPRER